MGRKPVPLPGDPADVDAIALSQDFSLEPF